MTLQTRDLAYAYLPGQPVLHEISLSIPQGRVTFILGANGSGKTTLLECLCGVRGVTAGEVTVDGTAIGLLRSRERARAIGYVPQIHEPVFAYTVWEVALMGRAPHLGFLSRPIAADWDAAESALESVGLWALRNRPYTATSGGERRLALIARGLAQGARYLLMDEPDAHLDPAYQHRIMSNVIRLASDGFTAIVSSHTPNNALLYADWVIFLANGRVIMEGPPTEVITPGNLEKAYGMPFEVIKDNEERRAVLPVINPVPHREGGQEKACVSRHDARNSRR
ncbi:MAG: ABC transporter ATP-binding protein [Candidatus Bipolaricaulota bacterium]|nr:ABC transporter ATP-binding protein [Candidatus Bipolaricaulota bacterium]